MRPAFLSLSALALAGCLPAAAPLPAPSAAPAFRPEVFFDGPSHGDPVLTIRTKQPQHLHVESRGAAQPDGTFRLDQTITYADGHAEARTWIMERLGNGQYRASLTPDASGPVEARVDGNRFRIRYAMGSGLRMDQALSLRPGGQVADNVATVRWMGFLPVARLAETITRDG